MLAFLELVKKNTISSFGFTWTTFRQVSGLDFFFVKAFINLKLQTSEPLVGAAYGDGVYFAKEASYSMTYSEPSPNGDRFMYLARVLVGKHTKGKQRIKRPPAIDPRKPEILYDSVVNMDENPTIFVVFNDFHVYPKYLITFKVVSQ